MNKIKCIKCKKLTDKDLLLKIKYLKELKEGYICINCLKSNVWLIKKWITTTERGLKKYGKARKKQRAY